MTLQSFYKKSLHRFTTLYKTIQNFTNKSIAPVFTIHDSIVVLPDFADKAKKIMSDIIFNKTGLRPKIKREDWK
jgi:hypothetical protein